jgi:DNA-binding transcriptional MerR regulator
VRLRYYKKPNPEKVKEWIANNKRLYSKEIKELKFIIETGEKNEFTFSMYNALITGRKITPKMLESIKRIIKSSSPEHRRERESWLNTVLPKMNEIKELVNSTTWTSGYKAGANGFIDSLVKQANNSLRLSKNQMLAANKIYIKAKKRLAVDEKKVKKSENS